MLEIEDLTKVFGDKTAVRKVSITIREGEMVGIIGPSGAGKSTLLRCVNRLTDPSAGSIRWQGKTVSDLRGRKLRNWQRSCGMIFQQFNLVMRLDVLTNVLLGRLGYHPPLLSMMKYFSKEERAGALLKLIRVEMSEHILQRADTLSGGQQQRVAIARTLLQEPSIILADEPIASLDPRSAKRVMELIRAINREDGITVLCNLHTLDTARHYCDRIIGMLDGNVVYDGPPAGLNLATVRMIYGADRDLDFDETVTSTALEPDARDDECRIQAVSH